MINFDKFLASFITEMKKYQPITCYNLPGCIKKALEEQGLEYKDGEIVKSQRRVSAEAKENGYGESEDEEIVKLADEYYDKVLIKECDMKEEEAHHCRISYIHGAKAMLEKQDEHKKFRDSIQIGDRVTRNEDGVLVNLSQLNRVAKKDKKQGKQKPVEWKQENREELTEFENAMMHIGGSFFGENAGLDPNNTDTIKEQAELLLELAPKTEWSEEDEKKRKGLIKGLEDRMGFGWASDPFSREEYIDWLKSLRPQSHWKPSDEQMEALDRAQAELCNTEYNKPICDLIDSLKKLK